MRRARGVASIAAAVVFLVALAGCAPSTSPTASPANATPSAAGPPSATPSAHPSASSSSPAESRSPGGSTTGVVRDDSLLAVLPPDLDGNAVMAEEESFGEAATDAAFSDHVARAAFAVVTSPNDLASGVVAELRPGLLDDAFFADWR